MCKHISVFVIMHIINGSTYIWPLVAITYEETENVI